MASSPWRTEKDGVTVPLPSVAVATGQTRFSTVTATEWGPSAAGKASVPPPSPPSSPTSRDTPSTVTAVTR